MTHKLYLIFVSSLLLSSCATTVNEHVVSDISGVQNENVRGFVPVEPIPANSIVEITRGDPSELVTLDIRLLTKNEMLNLFADTRSKITVAKKDDSGNLSYLTGSITSEKGAYVAFMDFGNFFVDELKNENNERIGQARIGIGLRLVADIRTRKRGIDLGGLLKIGLAASRNELSGALEVRAMGLTSQEIINLLPGILPAVDEGSIQSALEAMAAVKSKIYEQDTVISPRILAVNLDEKVKIENADTNMTKVSERDIRPPESL